MHRAAFGLHAAFFVATYYPAHVARELLRNCKLKRVLRRHGTRQQLDRAKRVCRVGTRVGTRVGFEWG
jgi:hypothetical protein